MKCDSENRGLNQATTIGNMAGLNRVESENAGAEENTRGQSGRTAELSM